MIIQCCWCPPESNYMGEKEPLWDRRITGGICKPCAKQYFKLTDEKIDQALREEAGAPCVSK